MKITKLAIIPARGGSKRIPRKNIRDFLGNPIIYYSIKAAIDCGYFDEVMVSTDDLEIAEIALKFGAAIPFMRSYKAADDEATTIEVIQEVLASYQNKMGMVFDYVCCIYPTAPLIAIQDLQTGYQRLIENNVTSVYPVAQFSYPVWRGLKIEPDYTIKMVWPEFINSRSQDLTPIYHDAGQWYWFDPLKVQDSLLSDDSMCLVLSEHEVQDIDNDSDWLLAELKYKLIYER